MKIIIIEDDRKKGDQVLEVLRRSFPEAELAMYKSYQSGLAAVMSDPPDMLVLDMTMPTYDLSRSEPGGRTRPYAGREIMDEMRRAKLVRPVIVVTGFDVFGEGEGRITLEELTGDLRARYPDSFIGAVHYDASSVRWVEELNRFLDRAVGRVG